MFYLYEISSIEKINQYTLSREENNGAMTSFDTDKVEDAMDMASVYINRIVGLKNEYSISLLP